MEKRIPSREELQNALLSRCTREDVEKLRNAEVAVAGLGGLGSHVSGVSGQSRSGTSSPC